MYTLPLKFLYGSLRSKIAAHYIINIFGLIHSVVLVLLESPIVLGKYLQKESQRCR